MLEVPVTPSLSADVLLLAVGDKGRFRTRGSAGTVLAGALFCQEVLVGMPVGRVARDRAELVALVEARAPRAVQEVGAALTAVRVLAPVEHKVMGLFPRRGYEVLDQVAHTRAEQRLRAGLTAGARPDAHESALAVLCAVAGIARAVVGPPAGRAAGRALAAHLNDLRGVVGPDVAEVLLAVRQAYRRRDSDGNVFVPTGSGRDGYGDSGGDGDGGSGSGSDGSDGGGGGGGGGD